MHEVLPFPMRPVDVIRYMDDNGVLDVRGLSPDLVDRTSPSTWKSSWSRRWLTFRASGNSTVASANWIHRQPA